jgi:hypothetical protein
LRNWLNLQSIGYWHHTRFDARRNVASTSASALSARRQSSRPASAGHPAFSATMAVQDSPSARSGLARGEFDQIA